MRGGLRGVAGASCWPEWGLLPRAGARGPRAPKRCRGGHGRAYFVHMAGPQWSLPILGPCIVCPVVPGLPFGFWFVWLCLPPPRDSTHFAGLAWAPGVPSLWPAGWQQPCGVSVTLGWSMQSSRRVTCLLLSDSGVRGLCHGLLVKFPLSLFWGLSFLNTLLPPVLAV